MRAGLTRLAGDLMRWWRPVVFAVALIAATGSSLAQDAPSTNPDATAALKEAGRLWQARRLAESIRSLDRAIQLDPGYVVAYLRRGFAYSQLAQPARAVADFDTAVRLAPDRPEVYFERGQYFAHVEDYDRAITDYRRAIELAPWLRAAYNNLGRAHALKGDLNVALAVFDEALTAHPQNPSGFMERGLVFLRLGRRDHAEHEFRYAESLERDVRQRYADAIRAASKPGARHAPSGPTSGPPADRTVADAVRLTLQRRDRDAVAVLDAAIFAAPRNAEAYLQRAEAYYNLKQFALARQDVEQSVQLRPDHAEAHRIRARTAEAFGEIDRALAALDRAIQLDPGASMAYVDRGVLYVRHMPNRPGSAQRDFEQAVKVDPQNPYAWYNRALTYGFNPANPRMQWDYEIENLSRAIALKPDFAKAYGKRGVASIGKGNEPQHASVRDELWKRGAADLERAIQLDPRLRPSLLRDVEGLKLLPAIYAYGRWMWKILTDPSPPMRGGTSGADDACGGLRGGAANACNNRDWMAQKRYEGGNATGDDKRKYGAY